MTKTDLVPMLLDVSIDPCDGSVHSSLQYVLIRGFTAMGWEQPKAASEDMAMEILKMIRPSNLAAGGTVKPSKQSVVGENPISQGMLRTQEIMCAETMKAKIATLAQRFWSIHPSEIAAKNLTREQFYAREMEKLLIQPGPSDPSSTSSEVTILADIAKERQRQREVENWSSEHDDGHDTGEMAGAAACYALSTIKHWAKDQVIKLIWPWADEWWKPKDARRNLVKAGALIVAEIERLDRLEGPRP